MKKFSINLIFYSLFIMTINFSLVAGKKLKSNKNKRIEKLQNKVRDQKQKYKGRSGNAFYLHAKKMKKRNQQSNTMDTLLQIENSKRDIVFVAIEGQDNVYRVEHINN